jgi:hypothetical protein
MPLETGSHYVGGAIAAVIGKNVNRQKIGDGACGGLIEQGGDACDDAISLVQGRQGYGDTPNATHLLQGKPQYMTQKPKVFGKQKWSRWVPLRRR